MTEDEMAGWHHWLYGHEFKQTPGVGNGQGSLACCSPWGHNESDMTELLKLAKWCMQQHEWNLKICCQPKDAINKKPYIVLLHLYKMSRIDKSIETQADFLRLEEWRFGGGWQLNSASFCEGWIEMF